MLSCRMRTVCCSGHVLGGVYLGGVCPGGVSAQGGVCLGGVCPGVVCLGAESQTSVKTLPCHINVADGNHVKDTDPFLFCTLY